MATQPLSEAASGIYSPLKTGRLLSLDVFRGATIASMILVNNAGSWSHVYPQLLHAQWHGCTFTDLVFPFFLWIAGVSMTLSFARRIEKGESRRQLFLHSVRRAAILFGLGLLLNGFPFYNLATLRIPGVLQRIALCYLAAVAVYLLTRLRGQIICTFAFLGAYWMLMTLVPVPGYGPGVFERTGNLAQYIDSLFLTGHMYAATKTWDPEGILSTLPAISTVLFGVLAGHLLRSPRGAAEKTVWMLAAGNALLFAGWVFDAWMPINKNLWTTSYAVWTAGLAFIVFGICYWLVDALDARRWTGPLQVYGMNAIAVYVLAGAFSRILGIIKFDAASGQPAALKEVIFESLFQPLASPLNASLLYAIANVLLFYAVAWLMYRRGWFIRF